MSNLNKKRLPGGGAAGVWIRNLYPCPGSYEANLTMNGTAQGGAIPAGSYAIQIGNLGATGEHVRVAFGSTQVIANNRLTIGGSPAAATTGYLVPALVDGGDGIIRVPSNEDKAFFAVANASGGDVQVVTVTPLA